MKREQKDGASAAAQIRALVSESLGGTLVEVVGALIVTVTDEAVKEEKHKFNGLPDPSCLRLYR